MPAPQSVDWDGNGVADDSDEWIELHNASGEDIVLTGWMLDDVAEGGSTPYTFPPGALLGADAYGVYYRGQTGVVLNDEGDQVRLLASDGAVVDAIRYEGVPQDASYGRTEGCGDTWAISWQPSPGQPNTIPTPLPAPGPDVWLYLPLIQRPTS